MKFKKIKSIEFINTIHELIYQKKVLHTNQSIVIAFSGGQDSICLLFFIFILKKQWDWKIKVIWCHHLWQKQSFIGINHTLRVVLSLKIETSFIVTVEKIFDEQKARHWRYIVFFRLALFYQSKVILTGHTGTDRIETLLLNLFRGCGVDGLHSLYWSRLITLNKYKNFFLFNRAQESATLTNLSGAQGETKFPKVALSCAKGCSFEETADLASTKLRLAKGCPSSAWAKRFVTKRSFAGNRSFAPVEFERISDNFEVRSLIRACLNLSRNVKRITFGSRSKASLISGQATKHKHGQLGQGRLCPPEAYEITTSAKPLQ